MNGRLEVRASHLDGELVRVEFARSHLISDHPIALGGAGKGPTPAGLLLAALAASSALAGRAHADRHGLKVGHIGARAGQRIDQEGFAGALNDGPLPALSFVGAVFRLLEAEGQLDEGEKAALIDAMANTGIARAIEAGVELEEALTYRATDCAAPAAHKNAAHADSALAERLPEGAARTLIGATGWRLSASAIQDGVCVIDLGNACLVAGSTVEAARGPTPEELFLGALAACTAIYVGRNAALRDMPVQSVEVVVSADVPSDPRQPITRMDKTCEVSGRLTEQQVEDLRHCATFCAIGVTLQRGVAIRDTLAVEAAAGQAPGAAPLSGLARNPPAPVDVVCDDQSCCVPPAVVVN